MIGQLVLCTNDSFSARCEFLEEHCLTECFAHPLGIQMTFVERRNSWIGKASFLNVDREGNPT